MVIHILPNISRKKGNQIMKCGQLIDYNTRKSFLNNHTRAKYDEETSPRNFSEKLKLSVSLDQYSTVYSSLPNRRGATAINFLRVFHPQLCYFRH